MTRQRWSDELIAEQIKHYHSTHGEFPTNTALRELGLNGLSSAICKSGGFVAWAERLGMKRNESDSDFGWSGERAVQKALQDLGYNVERPLGVRSPYDLLINKALRVDVKTANFAQYGPCSGWFYRIGKEPTADLFALYQADTKVIYWIPWTVIPRTNVTITKTGGIYKRFKGNVDVVAQLLESRKADLLLVQSLMDEAA